MTNKIHLFSIFVITAILIGSVSTGTVAFADEDEDEKKKKDKKNKVLTGDGPPRDKLGKKGDGYIDNSSENCDYYLKTAKKTWTLSDELCGDASSQRVDSFFDVFYEIYSAPDSFFDIFIDPATGQHAVDSFFDIFVEVGELQAEQDARIAADEALQSNLDQEISDRQAGDATLQTQLDNLELVPGPQGETGPAGPQGETGPAGPQGETGPAGTTQSVFPVKYLDRTTSAYIPSVNDFTLFCTADFDGQILLDEPFPTGKILNIISFSNNCRIIGPPFGIYVDGNVYPLVDVDSGETMMIQKATSGYWVKIN